MLSVPPGLRTSLALAMALAGVAGAAYIGLRGIKASNKKEPPADPSPAEPTPQPEATTTPEAAPQPEPVSQVSAPKPVLEAAPKVELPTGSAEALEDAPLPILESAPVSQVSAAKPVAPKVELPTGSAEALEDAPLPILEPVLEVSASTPVLEAAPVPVLESSAPVSQPEPVLEVSAPAPVLEAAPIVEVMGAAEVLADTPRIVAEESELEDCSQSGLSFSDASIITTEKIEEAEKEAEVETESDEIETAEEHFTTETEEESLSENGNLEEHEENDIVVITDNTAEERRDSSPEPELSVSTGPSLSILPTDTQASFAGSMLSAENVKDLESATDESPAVSPSPLEDSQSRLSFSNASIITPEKVAEAEPETESVMEPPAEFSETISPEAASGLPSFDGSIITHEKVESEMSEDMKEAGDDVITTGSESKATSGVEELEPSTQTESKSDSD